MKKGNALYNTYPSPTILQKNIMKKVRKEILQHVEMTWNWPKSGNPRFVMISLPSPPAVPFLPRTPIVQNRGPKGSSLCSHLEASPRPICSPPLWPLPWWSSWGPGCLSQVPPPSGRHWVNSATGSCPESCAHPGCASGDCKIQISC